MENPMALTLLETAKIGRKSALKKRKPDVKSDALRKLQNPVFRSIRSRLSHQIAA
jgi:hypothetical protein